ncbi:phosphatase PAP2 family protein [Burkholderia thailandensis]|uniref:phosphatase PAP2 family protein n=1 Tax=Burkholderia thailandensis TaxID=57975 RepID=UPI0002DC012F|nr:phosphatase PAP2 family protein [Burkholderia thailandensis]AHI65602.1 PAP2 superfamily protein [Burkholderia thailandensis H0587]AIP63501.1 phosphoesterase [Burkholderia thailandensis]AOI53449.1 phosphoesterase [Burkholderia thailandensis]AOJ52451.1 phosphoesterase [Burkholderia thailandensis]AVR27024.1 phosphatase PAP2 family protein [Burkholderia thailandensis]
MWPAISNLGDAALTLPLSVACGAWLVRSSPERRYAVSWLALLAAGMLVVGLTKILYAGCGVQIRAIHFRVVSGHTMLASAVWPMALLLGLQWLRSDATLAAGLALAALIGTARVFDDAHTVSEVIAGWALGALVTLSFVRWRGAPAMSRRLRPYAFASLLAALAIAYGRHAPIQTAIEQYSPFLCSQFPW